VNAFLTLTSGDTTILVNYFNALSFTELREGTLILLAAGEQIIVDQTIEEIEAEIRVKAVWAK